jgi:hypothetical protein
MLAKKSAPDRSKIDLRDAGQLKCWAHELDVTADRLREIIEKVGNSAAAVKKELANQGSLASQRSPGDGVSHR